MSQRRRSNRAFSCTELSTVESSSRRLPWLLRAAIVLAAAACTRPERNSRTGWDLTER